MTIDDAYLAERERIRRHANPAQCLLSHHYHGSNVTWDGAMEITAWDFSFLKDAYEAVPALIAEVRRLQHEGDSMRRSLELQAITLNTLLDSNARLRVKRCHYCNSPMVERPREDDDGGPRYDCSEGCQ